MAVDLTTEYLGMTLSSPLVVSASPITSDLGILRRLEECGAAAAVLPSLFEEQVDDDYDRRFEPGGNGSSSSWLNGPDLSNYNAGPDVYLEHVRSAKEAVDIPIIGSLNGAADDDWVDYAQLIQEAGADALELNIYFVPTDYGLHSSDVERQYIDLITEVRKTISIPLAVKIGPFFTSLPHFAYRLEAAGANGLVLFNRYLEPDVDIQSLEIRPSLVLSSRHELRLPLRWLAILRDQVGLSLAATSGIHFAEDVIKALLVGADVAMMATVIMRYGPDCLLKLNAELERWHEEHGFSSVAEIKGSMSIGSCPDPSALQRINYMKSLVAFTDRDEMAQAFEWYRSP